MRPTPTQNLLALLLLLLATQLLILGCERLFLLQDVELLQAYQQALPRGEAAALQAASKVAGDNAGLRIVELQLHEGVGDLLALLVGCLAAGYFWWRSRASWLLPLLVLGTFALAASGTAGYLRGVVLPPLDSVFSFLALGGRFFAVGLTLSACFGLLVLLIGAKVLPAIPRRAATGPG